MKDSKSFLDDLLSFLSPSGDECRAELTDAVNSLREEFFPSEATTDFEKRFATGAKAPKAVVFGAGASCDMPIGIPTWSTLLKTAIMGHFVADKVSPALLSCISSIKKGKGSPFDVCAQTYGNCFDGYDLYELAQYVENMLKELYAADDRHGAEEIKKLVANEMYTVVEKSLYYDLNRSARENKQSIEEFVTEYNDGGKTLENHILYRIAQYIDDASIGRVLTYNYDNAFEFVFDNLENTKNANLMPIFIDDQLSNVDEQKCISVYHVHGYVPGFRERFTAQEPVQTALASKEASDLILSERSYDDLSYSSYKWRNVVQIDTFLRYNCLFIGFSADDKNFKRIVKLMGRSNDDPSKDDVKHYIIMTIDNYIDSMFGVDENGKNISEYVKTYIAHNKANGVYKKDVYKSVAATLDSSVLCTIEKAEKITNQEKLFAAKLLLYVLGARRKYLKRLDITPFWTLKDEARGLVDYLLK